MTKTEREIRNALRKSHETMRHLARIVARDEGGLSAIQRLRDSINETERQSVRYQDFIALGEKTKDTNTQEPTRE